MTIPVTAKTGSDQEPEVRVKLDAQSTHFNPACGTFLTGGELYAFTDSTVARVATCSGKCKAFSHSFFCTE